MSPRKLYIALGLVAAVVFVLHSGYKSGAPSLMEFNNPPLPVYRPMAALGMKTVEYVNIPADRVVEIEDEIDDSTEHVATDILTLAQDGQPVYVSINSPGGGVLSGAVIVSAIEAASTKAPIITICTKVCASMAAVIFSYGTSRYVYDRSIIMFHPASGGAQGEVDKMTSRLTTIQKYIGKMEAYIAARAGLSFQEYKAASSAELWLDGEDAVARHFADKLVSANIKKSPRLYFFSPPSSGKAKFNPLDLTWGLYGNP